MFQATKEIYEEMKKVDGLKAFTDETDSSSRVWLQFGVPGGGSYRIQFINNDNDKDTAVRIYGLVSKVPESKRAGLLSLLNDLNVEFRYYKFALDSDGDVNMEFDFPVRTDTLGPSCMELTVRANDIVEKVYPRIMQALWA